MQNYNAFNIYRKINITAYFKWVLIILDNVLHIRVILMSTNILILYKMDVLWLKI